MTPRITFFIIAGIVVYISLSLYHWGQVKNIPEKGKQKGAQSTLTKEKGEKNWVQVTTSPGATAESAKKIIPAVPAANGEQKTRQPPASSTGTPPEVPPAAGDKSPAAPVRPEQTMDDENKELLRTLQHERSINHRQSLEINKLNAQILSLRNELEDTAARLREKDGALEELRAQIPGPAAEPQETDAKDRQIRILKSTLASRLDALDKANERITGLAERLDRAGSALAESENAAARLRSLLSDTESAETTARLEADALDKKLKQAREDRERSLAQTSRLHAQLQQAETRLARLEKELDKARLSSEAMLRFGQEQREFVTPFRQQIEILNARVEDKNSELLDAEDEIARLRDQERSLHEEIDALRREIANNAALSEKLQQGSRSLEASQKHSAELTEQLKALAEQLNARDALVSSLKKELDDARKAEQEAAQQSERLQEETERGQQELAQAAQAVAALEQRLIASADRLQNLEDEFAAARKDNEQLSANIIKKEKLLEAARTESDQLASRLKEKEEQLTAAENARKTTQAALQKLEDARHAAAQADSHRENETITGLQQALEAAEARLSEADSEISSLKKSLADVEDQLARATPTDELHQEIDLLRQRAAERDKRHAAAEQRIATLQDENRLLREKAGAAEQEAARAVELAAELERKAAELDTIQKRIATLENEAADLQAELDRREKAFFTMEEEHASLQKERDRLILYTLDSDNDSVPDAGDRCPGTVAGAEVDRDGCEPDSDGDGVVDRLDLCPATPEQTEANPFGCARGEPIILTGVYFSGGATDLSPASQAYLDKVAEALKRFPDIRFEVGGHTDSIGETERNLTVSRQRAESTAAYLAARGVDGSRLESAGYGSEQPIADNSTPEGRAANRRVELKIIPAGTDELNASEEKADLPAR
ncbi:MAG: OmpA family protein [Desulfobulbaceae bacterium]|nr:OmpA family protein [Desulfobulbaceae bacterium]